jgi:hypothetical protein
MTDELLEAIKYFVKRQELVAQALHDFGLDLYAISVLGTGGWTLGIEGAKQLYEVNPNPLSENFRTALQRMIEINSPPLDQMGTWQDQNGEIWNYFMHGGGCRLRNPVTGEIIDWDCPSVIHFDVHKFCFHLEWQITKFPDKYPNLAAYLRKNDINTIAQKLIPELVNEGKLIHDAKRLYRIS